VIVYGIEELIVNIQGTSSIAQGDDAKFTSKVSGGYAPYDILWDFGDGVVSNEANPTHVYENSGTYTVTCTVTDSKDTQKTKTMTVEVSQTETSEVEISNVKGGLLLSATITSDVSVAWDINVEGFVLLGGHAQGTAEGVTQVKLPFTLAFGKVDITI
jgi:PKD repeat protein